MEIRQLTHIIESLICLAILLPLFFGPIATVRLDGFRQDMFALRDQLFDYAAAESMSFNDPAYRHLRQLMNGWIRYGHQLTFFRVCMTIIQTRTMNRSRDLTWTTKWENALGNIKDEEQKAALISFHNQAAFLVAKRLVLGSPILIALSLCGALTVVIHKGLNSITQLLKEAASSTVFHLVDTRLLEEEAVKAVTA